MEVGHRLRQISQSIGSLSRECMDWNVPEDCTEYEAYRWRFRHFETGRFIDILIDELKELRVVVTDNYVAAAIVEQEKRDECINGGKDA